MIFRKKMKLTDFLEGPYLDAVLENGTFRHAAFYDIFGRALRESVLQKTGGADLLKTAEQVPDAFLRDRSFKDRLANHDRWKCFRRPQLSRRLRLGGVPLEVQKFQIIHGKMPRSA